MASSVGGLRDASFDEEGWSAYFDGISQLLEEAARHYGVANPQYTEYVLGRMELSITSCRSLKSDMESSGLGLQSYIDSLQELLGCIVLIRRKWLEYQDLLDSSVGEYAYRTPASHGGGQGRPKFIIPKEQLEYLISLSFNYKEIAELLGVSRSTVFRYYYIHALWNQGNGTVEWNSEMEWWNDKYIVILPQAAMQRLRVHNEIFSCNDSSSRSSCVR